MLVPDSPEIETFPSPFAVGLSSENVAFRAPNMVTARILERELYQNGMVFSPVPEVVGELDGLQNVAKKLGRFTRSGMLDALGHVDVDTNTFKLGKITSSDIALKRDMLFWRFCMGAFKDQIRQFAEISHQDFMEFSGNRYDESLLQVRLQWHAPNQYNNEKLLIHFDPASCKYRMVILTHLATISEGPNSSTVNFVGSGLKSSIYLDRVDPNSFRQWRAENGQVARLVNSGVHARFMGHKNPRLCLKAVHYDESL